MRSTRTEGSDRYDLYECEILDLEHKDESVLTLTLRSDAIARLLPAGPVLDRPLHLLVRPQLPQERSDAEGTGHPLLRSELQRALAYIQEHLETGLSLPEVAAAAGLSLRCFGHLFKQAAGETPHQYVIRQRVERARRLLEQGRLSLAEVAMAVGFYDQAHLTNHFKRLTGTTPRAAKQGDKTLPRAF